MYIKSYCSIIASQNLPRRLEFNITRLPREIPLQVLTTNGSLLRLVEHRVGVEAVVVQGAVIVDVVRQVVVGVVMAVVDVAVVDVAVMDAVEAVRTVTPLTFHPPRIFPFVWRSGRIRRFVYNTGYMYIQWNPS